MSSLLEVGIVGLPNAGKSTLFNALAAKRLAETAPRPFTTIDPHETNIPVPDKYLDRLSKLVKPQKTIPATVTFIDIAGLVKGAHKGEGLGNQFLGKIREVNAIIHVVRGFPDPYIPHQHTTHEPGTIKQVLYDIEIVNLELQLAGIKYKPIIYVINVVELQVTQKKIMNRWRFKVEDKLKDPAMIVAAKLEEDLSDLEKKERKKYLNEIGIDKTGLELLVQKSYEVLDLITFYTIKGGKEVTAWSLKKGENVLEAAEKVHSDFAKKFIKAEVINIDQLLKVGGWRAAKEKGKVQLEGKDYLVKDNDVIEFKVGS